MNIRLSCLLVALLLEFSLWAQEKETIALSEKEIIKKGWNVGPLPVVGWDSDLGFQYGACVDVFNYGDGSRYPFYDYKINVEASAYTRGSSVLRCYGDLKSVIPHGKLFFDCTYFNAKKFDFYGFNGAAASYQGSQLVLYKGEGSSQTSAFNWMRRSQLRMVASVQRKLVGNLHWSAGVGYYHMTTGRIELEDYADQWTLYELYCRAGLIREDEAEGGHVTQFRAGLVYDSRNHDSDPTRGLNLEATLTAAPDWISRHGYSNLGFTFVGCQYVPVWQEHITFAYRVGVQLKLAGEVPYYFANNLNTLFFRKMYTEGLGGNASVRGINRNSVMGDGMAWLNTEFRLRLLNFRFINQNWGVALNPFFDAGRVIQPYRLEAQKRAQSIAPYSFFLEKDLFYSGEAECIHATAGCGLKLVMNHNLVISFEMAKPFRSLDGEKLWNNIGFNYLF